MKKLLVAALVAVVGLAFVVPVSALETEFGGYWRTRAFSYNNFTGEDETEVKDWNGVDTRTRLYFTAKINDNLKLVNKFEMDANWGNADNYGDIGTDGKKFEIKNTYADFNMGALNAKVGAQGIVISRGLLFDDDFAGAVLTFNGSNFSLPFIWMKPYEGGVGNDADDYDVDYLTVAPSFNAGSVNINPVITWATSDEISGWDPKGITSLIPNAEDMDIFFISLNMDVNLGVASIWFTGIYETGTIDVSGGHDVDVDAYLLALGGAIPLGIADLHGQVFYASGDDDANDSDMEEFWMPAGQSYYWSEIMGYGIMDEQTSNGAPADQIGNIIAGNLGASIKPMDKLTLKADLWYAALAEEDATGEEDLGFEVDLGVTIQLVENLNLDLIGAYLFAGDRTNANPDGSGQFDDDADPYELGARLSLSF